VSTVKTDAITAVSTNGDLSLDGLGTGGVSIASTLKMTKGGDIASASPLVIDTDGNYFDVTGTTNFAAMTVEAGNFFMLQFDGALTITHGSGIEIPGAANLTTASGDRLICYATAANTVEVMSVETEATVSAGGFTLSSTSATTSGTSVTFGSIPAGTNMIILMLNGVSASSTGGYWTTIGDAGGLETSGYLNGQHAIQGSSIGNHALSTAHPLVETIVNGGPLFHGMVIYTLLESSSFTWSIIGQIHCSGHEEGNWSAGTKSLTAELTQISLITANTMDAGEASIMYM